MHQLVKHKRLNLKYDWIESFKQTNTKGYQNI